MRAVKGDKPEVPHLNGALLARSGALAPDLSPVGMTRPFDPVSLLRLQRLAGNGAVTAFVQRRTVCDPNNPDDCKEVEDEADGGTPAADEAKKDEGGADQPAGMSTPEGTSAPAPAPEQDQTPADGGTPAADETKKDEGGADQPAGMSTPEGTSAPAPEQDQTPANGGTPAADETKKDEGGADQPAGMSTPEGTSAPAPEQDQTPANGGTPAADEAKKDDGGSTPAGDGPTSTPEAKDEEPVDDQSANGLFDKAITAGDNAKALGIVVSSKGYGGKNVESITYAGGQAEDGLTSGELGAGKPQKVTIGPTAMAGYQYCASIVGHEVQHAQQRSGDQPITDSAVREFLSYTWQVFEGPPLEPKDKNANAFQAMKAYARMANPDDKILYQPKFEQVRDVYSQTAGAQAPAQAPAAAP